MNNAPKNEVRIMKKIACWICLSVAGLLLGACDAEMPDICTLAGDHVAQCGGLDAAYSSGAPCQGKSAELAQQMLNTSCAQMKGAGGKSDALSSPTSMAICVSLGIPLFLTGGAEGELCCFPYNCGSGLTCSSHTCKPKLGAGSTCKRNGHCKSGLACVFGTCDTPREEG